MTRYNPISVLVKSGKHYRIFNTQCFSIRPITNLFFRFNPTYEILAVKDGHFSTQFPVDNQQWRRLPNNKVADMYRILESEDLYKLEIPKGEDIKSYLLENYPYRTALNLWYIYAAKNKIYPSKQPFTGVQVSTVPDWIINDIGLCEHPTFVHDNDNPYINKEDILKWYDGRRYDKYINGYMASGYLLEKIRMEIQQTDEDTDNTTENE